MADAAGSVDNDWIQDAMKPLSVTLVQRKSDNYRKLTGWWSYPVPEFTWQTVPVDPVNFRVTIEGKPDLVVLDDWIFGKVNKNGSKMAYVTVDSARSDDQLRRNIHQSADADLILVDSDLF